MSAANITIDGGFVVHRPGVNGRPHCRPHRQPVGALHLVAKDVTCKRCLAGRPADSDAVRGWALGFLLAAVEAYVGDPHGDHDFDFRDTHALRGKLAYVKRCLESGQVEPGDVR